MADARQVVSACHYPPVATSSLLTYEICRPLHPDVEAQCGYLCAMGTHGDLGNTLKWRSPFPDMTEVFKSFSKKTINDAVSLINARMRTSARSFAPLLTRAQQEELRNSMLYLPGKLC